MSIRRPPITLLVMIVGPNIIFDPTRQELSVADVVMAVSVTSEVMLLQSDDGDGGGDGDQVMAGMTSSEAASRPGPKTEMKTKRIVRLASIRTIDPPSGFTSPGVPNSLNPAITTTGPGGPNMSSSPSQPLSAVGGLPGSKQRMTEAVMGEAVTGEERVEGVWSPKRGGFKRAMVLEIVKRVLQPGGVAEEVLDGLEGVDLD